MVYITGYGIITALGNSVAAHKKAMLQPDHALSFPEILKTRHRGLPVGEIKLSDEALRTQLKIPRQQYNRSTLLAIHALQETIAGLDSSTLSSSKIAFVNATTVGGMNNVEQFYDSLITVDNNDFFTEIVNTSDCGGCTRLLASFFGLSGFQATISTACSSSANALLFGARMIQNGITDIAICGGTDALSAFTLNGFNSLKNVDKEFCRPFDQHRNGLNLGEGAAYLVLESEQSVRRRNARCMATLRGFGNTNEAYHLTAPASDGAGAIRTMRTALDGAGLNPSDIGYINAHGTATVGNDLSEGIAIQRLFGIDNPPPFSSVKAYMGHTLAASGAVAAIISCLCLQYQFVPANLRFTTPMEEMILKPQALPATHYPISSVLTNSFGFGGNNVSLVFGAA